MYRELNHIVRNARALQEMLQEYEEDTSGWGKGKEVFMDEMGKA